MERNGDVVTEYNSCHPENFQLNINTSEIDINKMCKDDNSESLFCKMSSKMRSDSIMASEFKSETEVPVSGLKNQCLENLSRAKTDFVNSDEHILSIIQKTADKAVSNCLLPIWEKTSELCSFPPHSIAQSNILSEDSFINGKKILNSTENDFHLNNDSVITNCSNSNAIYSSDSNLSAVSDNFPQNFKDELSTSSIEEIFCPIASDLNEIKKKCIAQCESKNDNASLEKDNNIVENSEFSPQYVNLNSSNFPKLDNKKEIEFNLKGDRKMPELIPTICVDEDSVPFQEKKINEVVNIADSPEMPKLVPFSTDIEELNKIKSERIDDSDCFKSTNFQLQTSAKRVLFLQDEIGCINDAKQSKLDAGLQNCISEIYSSSKEFKSSAEYLDGEMKDKSGSIHSEDSASCESSTRNSVDKTFQSKDDWKFEISDFHNSFSENSQLANKEFKKETCLRNDDKIKSEDNESQDSANQPQVMLRKLSLDECLSLNSSEKPVLGKISEADCLEVETKFSFKHCLPFNDSDDNDSLVGKPECQENKNSSSESPEIEEIEGVRFFQFRSKHAMEEFNKQPASLEVDMEMIVPTKTTDITQIKGWRNKYFAPESQFQPSYHKTENNSEESSQNAVSLPPLGEQTDSKCLDFHNRASDAKCFSHQEFSSLPDSKALKDDIKIESTANVLSSITINSGLEEKKQVPTNETKAFKEPNADDPMSAFVSKNLDEFLLNSSTLNINCLQKINPNIIPISPNAPILKIGKLCKNDSHLNISYKRKFFYKVRHELKDPLNTIVKEETFTPLITISSGESSSDDDIPVAKLSRAVTRVASRLNRSISNKCLKRRMSDKSSDENSQRLVLRLKKDIKGASEGYKVSDISLEGPESPSSSSLSSSSSSNTESEEDLPDAFKIPADGTLPIIKETIFLKDNEPKLLEEFLSNLNMYGTSKDVAMLVQSNQSYFVKGPVLTEQHCNEALDALVSNKEFLDLKNKSIPKKKLKAWQKYLPKKLSKIQQQQISNKSLKQNLNLSKLKSKNFESVSNTKEKIKEAKLNYNEKISKLNEKSKVKFDSSQKASAIKRNIKTQQMSLDKNIKVKRKSKLHIDTSDLLIERGKRSIRLPARYLDSAVLAAGSEWVSPIFIDNEKKNRKQLLDVLDKITPNKEPDIHSESGKTENIMNSAKQIIRKKTVEGPGKSLKRPLKGYINPKRQKNEHIKPKTKVPKSIENQDASLNLNSQSQSKSTTSLNDGTCPFSSCFCSPCTRTVSFQVLKKLFVCFSAHIKKPNENECSGNINHAHKTEIVSSKKYLKLGKSCTEVSVKITDHDTVKESKSEPNYQNNFIEKIKSVASTDAIISQKHNAIESTVSKYIVPRSSMLSPSSSINSSMIVTNLISESIRSQSSTVSKMVSQNSTLQIVNSSANNILLPNIYDKDFAVPDEKVNNGLSRNVSGPGIGNKVLFFMPPFSTPKNVNVPIVSNALSIQKVQKTLSENISKPAILTRKVVSENSGKAAQSESSQLLPDSNSSNSLKLATMPALSPSNTNNSFNSTSTFLKLSKTLENTEITPLMCGSSQLNPLIKNPGLNSNSTVLGTPDNPSLIPKSGNPAQKVPFVKAFRVGDSVFLYPSDAKSSLTNSNDSVQHSLLTVPSSEISANNNSKLTFILSNTVKKDPLNNCIGSESNLMTNMKKDVNVDSKTSESATDHHNYHKKPSSEHRRKSPLSERKFPVESESDSDASDSDESDSDIDVDTVDFQFDPLSKLRENIQADSDTDISDEDCDSIFSSSMYSVISAGRKKTVRERKRRLLIKNSFERLKKSSYCLKNARSCNEILNMATSCISKLKQQEMGCIKIKKMQCLYNALLLKRLKDQILGIQDCKIRKSIKRQCIRNLALDWEICRMKKNQILPQSQARDTFSSPEVETDQSHSVAKIELQKKGIKTVDKDIIYAELDIEIESQQTGARKELKVKSQSSEKSEGDSKTIKPSSLTNELSKQPEMNTKFVEHHVMDADTIEQPHVQLRILEPPSDNEEIDINLQTIEKLPEKGSVAVTASPEPSSTTSLHTVKRRLQFRTTSDAHTSDEDHLVIDLSEESMDVEGKNEPDNAPPELTSDTPLNSDTEKVAMKKFPGLIPLFSSDFYKDEKEMEKIARSKIVLGLDPLDVDKKTENSPCVINSKMSTRRNSVSNLATLQPAQNEVLDVPSNQKISVPMTDLKTLRIQVSSALNAGNKLLGSPEAQNTHLKNGQTPHSLVSDSVTPKKPCSVNEDGQRHTPHRSCNDVRILHGVGNMYADSPPHSFGSCQEVKQIFPEEIIIDDSDDEVMEVDKSTLNSTSESFVVESSSKQTHNDVNMEKDSQMEITHL
ncbi:uncharacterized protein NPIL_149271 [Nephila pilipes]|uniref:BHLH domain-containing protein n=1 Tax=Nephila pilipes TaxID=299642 RepID=A0A8X6NEK0_NEPPI|nr:uncharacterized protein NPIL_149271 [Nephila pilipes]